MKKIWFVCLLLTNISLLWGQSYNLTMNLKKRKTYTLQVENIVGSKQIIHGQQVQSDASSKVKIAFKVEQKNRFNYQTKANYANALLDMSTIINDTPMTLAAVKDYVSEGLKEIENKSFKIDFNAKGKLAKITGTEDFLHLPQKYLERKYTRKPKISALELKQVGEQVRSAFGVEQLRSNLESLLTIFPNNRVRIGDSWTVKTYLSTGLPVQIETTYKLISVDKKGITIRGKADFASQNRTVTLMQGQQVGFTMEGGIESEITLDPSSKWITFAHIKQVAKGKSTLPKDNSHPQGQEIPFDSSSELIVSGQTK